MTALDYRLASRADIPALQRIVDRSVGELQRAFLSQQQIVASRGFMGVDTRLIDDGTYFIVARAGMMAGCGGWSRRATPYGGDTTPGRDDRLLDPAKEPARVRAMYTDPDHVREGVGRRILSLCEAAAQKEGFTMLELSSTLAGAPLYRSFGFTPVREFTDSGVPLITMRKNITLQA